jgi:tetratricopeptide (TPR) repeat protein
MTNLEHQGPADSQTGQPVFVSYSSDNQDAAEALVEHLESQGIGCWLATRSISGGASFAEEIVQAIRAARVLLLLVSPECNESKHTSKEVTLAVDLGLALLPIRIVRFDPWGYLSYFLADCQWIDAADEGVGKHLSLITETVKSLLVGPWRRDATGKITTGALPSGVVSGARLGIRSPAPYLPLRLPRPGASPGQQPSLWLQAHHAFIELKHRDEELADLRGFVSGAGLFRWRLMVGEAGMGKTRLAIEFAKQLQSEGLHAGLLDGHGLDLFVRSAGFAGWRPPVPTFITVDYAASKKKSLRALLQHLAGLELDSGPEAGEVSRTPPVRLLLLERHGDEDKGWMEDLLSCGEGQVGDLLRNTCYQGITELLPPRSQDGSEAKTVDAEATCSIIQATFASWEKATGGKAPELPDFPDTDWRRIQMNTGNRPLYIQMASIHACESGSAEMLPLWGRGELLRAAVGRELAYVARACGDQGELRKSVNHVAAILCVAGIGLSKGRRWRGIVDEELKTIGMSHLSAGQVEQCRKAIFEEPESLDGEEETGLIQPDIVSEGFAATVFRKEKAEFGISPQDTLGQVVEWVGLKAWSNLIRMAQDLNGIEGFEEVEKWPLDVAESRDVVELQAVLDLIPERTASLHETGIAIGDLVIRKMGDFADEEKAVLLVKLATHRHRGRKGDTGALHGANEELQQAVELLQGLVRKVPTDKRLALLAKAHWELGWVLDDIRRAIENDAYLRLAVDHGLLGALAAVNHYPADTGSVECTGDSVRKLLALPVPDEVQRKVVYADLLIHLSIAFEDLAELNATSLKRISKHPGDLGYLNIAADLALRAVETGEDLAAINWRLYGPALGRFLHNLGQRQASLGQVDEALANVERSVLIRREFAYAKSDEHAESLILTLLTLMSLQFRRCDPDAAKQTYDGVIAFCNEFASHNPLAGRPLLASAFARMFEWSLRQEKTQDALRHLLRSKEVLEEVIRHDFRAHCPALRRCYYNLSIVYGMMDNSDARAEYETKARELRKRWMLFRRTRMTEGSMAYYRGEILKIIGDLDEAIASAKASAAMFKQELANVDPKTQPIDYVITACNLTAALAEAGDLSGDLDMLREGEQLARDLLALPGADGAKIPLPLGALMHNLGHLLFRRGEIEGDREVLSEAIDVLEKAAEHLKAKGRDVDVTILQGILDRARKAMDGLPQKPTGSGT